MRRALALVLLACNGAACGAERSAGPELTAPASELGLSVKSLPPEGVAVEVSRRRSEELVLIGLDGRVLERPNLRIDAESQLYRNILVLRSPRTARRFVVGSLGELIRYRRSAGYPRRLEWSRDRTCGTFARRARSDYRLCGQEPQEPTAVEVVDGGSRRVVAGRPAHSRPLSEHIGSWRDAYLSPDGKTVVATWSVECEIPTAFFADAVGGRLRPVTGEKDWRNSAESVGLGWTRRGLAVVQLMEGACGRGFRKPGIYLVDPRTGGHRLVYAVRHAFAVMWRR